MNSTTLLALLSEALAAAQAPRSDADFWFVVASTVLTVLMLIVCGAVTRLLSHLGKLAEKLERIDKAHTQRHHDLQLEVREISAQLRELRAQGPGGSDAS